MPNRQSLSQSELIQFTKWMAENKQVIETEKFTLAQVCERVLRDTQLAVSLKTARKVVTGFGLQLTAMRKPRRKTAAGGDRNKHDRGRFMARLLRDTLDGIDNICADLQIEPERVLSINRRKALRGLCNNVGMQTLLALYEADNVSSETAPAAGA